MSLSKSTLYLTAGLLLICCKNLSDTTAKNPNKYYSSNKQAIDSLIRNRNSIQSNQNHNLVFSLSDSIYYQFKLIEKALKEKSFRVCDSIRQNLKDSTIIVPELYLEINLLEAIKQGTDGKYIISDSLFQDLSKYGIKYFLAQDEISLKIREKHAEMWRYDANNPQKAMGILQLQDSILNLIPSFTKFHRTQLYTLATTYRILGKLDEALTTATELRIKLQEQLKLDTAFYYSVSKVIGNIYTDMEDRPEANKYFEEHLIYQESKNKVTAHDYINFAIQLSSDFQYEKTNEYLEKGRLLIKSKSDSFYYNRSLGFHFVHFEKNKESLPYLIDACKYCLRKPDQYSCPYNIQWLGEAYELMNKPDSALYFYDMAVKMLTGKSFNKLKISEFNKHENIEFYFLAFQRAYLEKYRIGNKTSDLLKVLEYANTMEKYFNDISYFSAGIQKLIDFQIFHELFGYGAYASFKIWEQKRDSGYLYRTFILLEKCKSSDWDKKQLANQAGLNVNEKHALNKLDSLKRKVVEYEIEFNKFSTEINSKNLRAALMEKNKYYQYIYDSLQSIKKFIDSNSVYKPEFDKIKVRSDTTILVYFHTNRLHTYQYLIENNHLEGLELKNTVSFLDTIKSYLVLIKKLGLKENEHTLKSRYSNTIYSNLNLGNISNYKLIHIIPDGPIHSLSIEELIKENNNSNKITQQFYSFSLEDALKIKISDTPKVLLALAYGSANDNDKFASLPGSIKEVNEVANNFKGKRIILKNNEVTIDNFLKYAPLADCIYLATHAQSDTYCRFKNRLIFHGKSGNEYLNINQINFELIHCLSVTLSNCESNIGTSFRGTNYTLNKYFKDRSSFVYSSISKISDIDRTKLLMYY